jgi:ribosome-associated translation inhibitor RaiA
VARELQYACVMTIPLQITFHGLDSSAAIEARVREWTEKLERVFPRIVRCLVAIEQPHAQHRKGNQFHVRIELSVPGEDIIVSNDPGRDEDHEDPYVALRDAFRAARRQLEAHSEKLRGDIKRHGAPGGDSMSSNALAASTGGRSLS